MPDAKANILVVFYSRDGSVESLARAVSEGARRAGAEVRLRRVPDIVSPAAAVLLGAEINLRLKTVKD